MQIAIAKKPRPWPSHGSIVIASIDKSRKPLSYGTSRHFAEGLKIRVALGTKRDIGASPLPKRIYECTFRPAAANLWPRPSHHLKYDAATACISKIVFARNREGKRRHVALPRRRCLRGNEATEAAMRAQDQTRLHLTASQPKPPRSPATAIREARMNFAAALNLGSKLSSMYLVYYVNTLCRHPRAASGNAKSETPSPAGVPQRRCQWPF